MRKETSSGNMQPCAERRRYIAAPWYRRTLALIVALLCVIPLSAQTQYGSIRGTVTDQSEAALPGVTVTLSSPALLVEQTSVSDGVGQYRFEQLPVGTYKLRFELSGFQALIREAVQVPAGFNA